MKSASINNNGSKNNEFYRKHFTTLIISLISAIFVMIALVVFLLYQIHHRPLPQFSAHASNGNIIRLTASYEPNMLSSTLIKWANQAVVAAYTYDFLNYPDQLKLAQPYFTENGWKLYSRSIQDLINTMVKNQLIVNGVVSGPAVISNQGDLPSVGRAWRVQVPFLVSYQAAENIRTDNFIVTLTLVTIPTTQNPTGIGIDQFVMR